MGYPSLTPVAERFWHNRDVRLKKVWAHVVDR